MTIYKYEDPNPGVLETFVNPGVSEVALECVEFTSLCPRTGQPDYYKFRIVYQPKEKCLESKSLKLYLGMFRQYGGFAEQITKKICEDIYSVLNPIGLTVMSKSTTRGGIWIEACSRK